MNSRPPWDVTAAAAAAAAEPPAGSRAGRRLAVAMLFTAAALDLTRCGLVLAAARNLASAAGLVTAGVAAAALTARTARGCQAGQPWAGWAALLIGTASVPQAAASGFRNPYTIPDTATAAVGILLAITILATAGRAPRDGGPSAGTGTLSSLTSRAGAHRGPARRPRRERTRPGSRRSASSRHCRRE